MPDLVAINVKADQNVTATMEEVAGSVRRVEDVVVDGMGRSEESFDEAARASGRYADALDSASGGISQFSGAIGDVGGAMTGFVDLQKEGKERAMRLAQATQDVAQAQEDMEQAVRDSAQAMLNLEQSARDANAALLEGERAAIDAEQAQLDIKIRQEEYNAAVKEFGVNSNEAIQASIDLKGAQLSLKEANEAQAQAQQNAKQATEDGAQAHRELSQAQLNAKQGQLDLNSAMQEAKPPGALEQWGKRMEMIAPIIMGAVGAIDLMTLANRALAGSFIQSAASAVAQRVATIAGTAATYVATAAQWLWNIAMSANPIGLIILAIAALVGAIVWIATQTTWFQDLWKAIWGAIGDPVKAAWEWIQNSAQAVWDFLVAAFTAVKDAIISAFKFAVDFVVGYFEFIISIPGRIVSVFQRIGEAIYAPFRWAFNNIAKAWNNSVGNLKFSIPGWVPGIGGNTFSLPKLPLLERGGRILETGMYIGHKGETVLPARTAPLNGSSSADVDSIELTGDGTALAELLLALIARAVRRKGGNPDVLGIKASTVGVGLAY